MDDSGGLLGPRTSGYDDSRGNLDVGVRIQPDPSWIPLCPVSCKRLLGRHLRLYAESEHVLIGFAHRELSQAPRLRDWGEDNVRSETAILLE